MKPRIYLDACCLNRPFDDQSKVIIRMEAEAVKAILRRFDKGFWHWVSSDVLLAEINQTPDEQRREDLLDLEAKADERIPFQRSKVLNLAALWRGRGLRTFDSLHIAIAEFARTNVFLTTDRKFLAALRRYSDEYGFKADNPLSYILEVKKNA